MANAQDGDAVLHYVQAGEHSPVYTGKISQPYPAHFTNDPYLYTSAFTDGELSVNGIDYPRVMMRLDWYRDRLLLMPPGGLYEIILPPELVGHARLHGYHIFYHGNDSLKGSPRQGYYLLLHDGLCRVRSRTVCTMRETTTGNGLTGWFVRSDKYYILKDGVYHAVRSKGSVLKVFASHRMELNRFITVHKLDFRRKAAEAIVATVKEYERLNSGL